MIVMKERNILKDCPFCGGEAYIGDSWDGSVSVKCCVCGCGTPPSGFKETVIRKWNHRYELPVSGRNPENQKKDTQE